MTVLKNVDVLMGARRRGYVGRGRLRVQQAMNALVNAGVDRERLFIRIRTPPAGSRLESYSAIFIDNQEKPLTFDSWHGSPGLGQLQTFFSAMLFDLLEQAGYDREEGAA